MPTRARITLQQISPSTLGQEFVEQSVAEYAEVIKEVARSETQQVQKQLSRPELQLVEGIGEMRL